MRCLCFHIRNGDTLRETNTASDDNKLIVSGLWHGVVGLSEPGDGPRLPDGGPSRVTTKPPRRTLTNLYVRTGSRT